MKFVNLLFFLIGAFKADAFTLSNSSNVKGFAGGEVSFVVNTSNCPGSVDVVGLIKEAMKVWNQVPTSSLKVKYGGTTTSTTDGNPIVVYCETNFQAVTSADEDGVPAVARANGTTQLQTGLMVLNASTGDANIANVSKIGLQVVITHEMGHALGLGHSQTPDAVMYYTYSFKSELNLAQDDIDGISYLYPSDEFDNNEFAGCGSIEKTSPPKAGQLGLVLLSLLFPFMTLFIIKYRNYSKV